MELNIELVSRLRNEGLSWRQIGVFLAQDLPDEPYRLQERARNMWRREFGGQEKEAEVIRTSVKTNRDASVVSEMTQLGSDANSMDESALLKKHGYDPAYWKVIESTCARRADVWSSRVKVVAKAVPQLDGDEFADFLGRAVSRMEKPVERPYSDNYLDMPNKLAIVALYDIHYGRKGVDGSDHKRTEEEVQSVIGQISTRLLDRDLKEIVLTIGQDFLNADNIAGGTTNGTPQDNSINWHEMLSGGLALAMWTVDKLADIAPVRVVYNEGNHDRVFSYAIVKALEQRYRDCGNVTVDSGAEPRKYIEYGRTLIGLSHGKDETNLSTLMQMEMSQAWGRTAYRYWFLGHLHHLEVDEKDGVTIFRCPSLAFADDWGRRKGFVGSDNSTLCAIVGTEGVEDIWLIRP